jgi:hypothetical protein
MSSDVAVIVGAIVIFGGALALFIAAHRTEKRRRAAYLALAEQRGWDYEFVRTRGNQPSELRFSDPASGIRLVVTRKLTRKSGSSTTTKGGATVASLREPRLQGGLAVYTPPMDADLAKAASTMLGIFDNSVARFVIGKLLGEEFGEHVGQLVEQPVPAGVAVSILATVDPASFIDAAPIARALKEADDEKAMAMVSETGTRLRLGRALNEAADIEQFFDTALTLDRALRGGPAQRLSS